MAGAPSQVLRPRGAGALTTTLVTRLRASWCTWRASVLTALACVAVFRVATLLIGMVAAGSLGVEQWHRYDATWWDRIAVSGYGTHTEGLLSDGAFAPAYAMAMRGAMWLLHLGPLAAGFLVSTLCLLIAAAVVHRLVLDDHGARAATTAVVLMLAWPTAVFFAAPYSESLSLALVALALLAARRERWWWAGTFAALAMLSKYVLGLLVVAVVVDHLVRRRRRGALPRLDALAGLVLPGAAALAGILLFQHARFGQPFFFLSAEKRAWGHGLATPVQLALNARRELVSAAQLGALPQLRSFFLDDVTILSLAALAVFMLRRRREHPAETALITLIAATFLCMSGPDSVARYALVLAPVFVVLGPVLARQRPARRLLVLGAFAAVMVLQTATFVTGGWAG